MSKKTIIVTFSIIAAITSGLIIAGFYFKQSDEDKLSGLTDIFDVASDGTIAYVSYQSGRQYIILNREEQVQLAHPINEDEVILDIAFSSDSAALIYSTIHKEIEENLHTTIHKIKMDSFEDVKLFQQTGVITELEYDPKNSDIIYYLKANTFENYSPIARANPHEFDIYSFHTQKKEHTKHTNFDSYLMGSLKISFIDDSVYIQMFNEIDSASADEIFAQKLHIFKIPLDDPEQFTILTNLDKDEDIYDFAFLNDEQKIIYQSVSNINGGGIFQYELFSYDLQTTEEIQLTNLKEYASRPILSADYNTIYFIVDKQFGGKYPDYYLYKMDVNGENIEEFELVNDL